VNRSVYFVKDKHLVYEVIMPERLRMQPFQPSSQVTVTKCGMNVTLCVGLLLFFPTVISNVVMV